MPELPEVESVRRSLNELVAGKNIKNVSVHWPKIIKYPLEVEQFQDALQGQLIHTVERRGKFLIFQLDDYSLVSHLRMEGNYSLHHNEDSPDKHTHILFHFTDGYTLFYRDVRKFGTMHLFSKGTENDQLPLSKLGPEPFSDECTLEYLVENLSKTDRCIKAALLDQTIVSGLGNIYVDEVLIRSRIHPERVAKTLNKAEILPLLQEMKATLLESIEAGGSSVNSYMNSHGLSGTYQEKLKVYGKKGEPCSFCGTEIEKTKVAGRGTHFCPQCQIR
ncbi:DNA-formamidopyrimidine glycosylase [Lederbergia galactosidilytica]|uniref:Formamidopyrimidine-DNA glycosylase n=1 Tax=Lederbergia galactosidilytica TaxID=217031 RepID=A0A177ZKB0_9BACI|nr:DNA-formamidopyrimidine glycosylase [Lederbergia galactosidilytica]KRG14514.1 5-hydroxymethyluracil DNA glycosylase [Virgibacillus soli]OAK68224.1 5-hydroxymethyluracil DNA glycosylase [Lederbergia galactosidilytica]